MASKILSTPPTPLRFGRNYHRIRNGVAIIIRDVSVRHGCPSGDGKWDDQATHMNPSLMPIFEVEEGPEQKQEGVILSVLARSFTNIVQVVEIIPFGVCTYVRMYV